MRPQPNAARPDAKKKKKKPPPEKKKKPMPPESQTESTRMERNEVQSQSPIFRRRSNRVSRYDSICGQMRSDSAGSRPRRVSDPSRQTQCEVTRVVGGVRTAMRDLMNAEFADRRYSASGYCARGVLASTTISDAYGSLLDRTYMGERTRQTVAISHVRIWISSRKSHPFLALPCRRSIET